MQDRILSIYTNLTGRNLNQIKSTLSTLGVKDEEMARRFRTLLEKSSSILTQKWLSGKKYYRTKFAMEAIRNYPESAIELSICIDAITCILDDFFDEPLPEKSKTLYVIEAGRLLGNLFYLNIEKEVRKAIEKYFNSLIIIGTLERSFYDLIKSEKNEEKIKTYLKMLFDVRAIDVDLFFWLPLFKLKKETLFVKVVKSARAFRALNLLNKDFRDWQYDREKGNRTVFTLLEERRNLLKESVRFLTQKYLTELENTRNESDITETLYEMGRREEQDISNFINS